MHTILAYHFFSKNGTKAKLSPHLLYLYLKFMDSNKTSSLLGFMNNIVHAIHFMRTWGVNFSISDAVACTFLMTRTRKLVVTFAIFHFSCLYYLNTLCTSSCICFLYSKIAFVCFSSPQKSHLLEQRMWILGQVLVRPFQKRTCPSAKFSRILLCHFPEAQHPLVVPLCV